MTILAMQTKLGISEQGMEELRVQDQAGSLPGNYADLETYLLAQIWDKLQERRVGVEERLKILKSQAQKTFEGYEAFLDKLDAFIQGLES